MSSSPQRSTNKPDLVYLLEPLDKDTFYALKRTQHVTTYGGTVLADAVKAKTPDVNTKELNRLIAKAKFTSNAFVKLNVHQHGTLELGSKWIMFRSDPQREVTTSPFDQLNPLKSRDKNVATAATAAVGSGSETLPKNGVGVDNAQDDDSPRGGGGGQVEPHGDHGDELTVSADKNAASVNSGLETVPKNGGDTSQHGESLPGGSQVEPPVDHGEELETNGDRQIQSTTQEPEKDIAAAQVAQSLPEVSAGAGTRADADPENMEEKELLSHMNFMLLCLRTVQEL